MCKRILPTFCRMGRWLVNPVPTFRRVGRWVWRVAPRVALGLVAICVLAAVPWTYFNVKWGRELEAELAELRAAGAPLTLAEAAPKPVPESENAAVLYQNVFGIRFPPDDTTPLHPLANMSSEETKAIEAYVSPQNAPQRTDMDSQVGAVLERPHVVEGLAILRKASEMPHCVLPVNWGGRPTALFPRIMIDRFREAARLAVAQALWTARRGDVDAALDWCIVALRISEHIATWPTLLGQLVCIAVQGTIFDTLEDILFSAAPSLPAAARLEECLSGLDLRSAYLRGLAGERAYGLDSIDRLGHSIRLGGPLQKGNMLTYLKHMNEQVALARVPYHEAKPRFEALERKIKETPRYLMAFARSPLFSMAAAKRDRAIARLSECRVVLALKTYKQRRGAYPANLDELQATLDWRLPEDPFSGQAFIYRRDGGGFILYSVGPNLEDDRGKRIERKAASEKDSDIVWACQQ